MRNRPRPGGPRRAWLSARLACNSGRRQCRWPPADLAARAAGRCCFAYLDASAIVKLVVAEPETAALERALEDRAGLFSSRLGAAEVIRAARRRSNRRVLQQTDEVLDALVLMDVTPPIL